MKNLTKVADFVNSVVQKTPVRSEQLFKEIMAEKILNRLSERRAEIAQTLFREAAEECCIEYMDEKGKKCTMKCSSQSDAEAKLKKMKSDRSIKNPQIVTKTK
jgi:replicative superfamily II helicase